MPKAEEYYKGCISLPMYPELTDQEVDYIAEKVSMYAK
jgi:dTDP-4-amino-4,6-dideoxygalactose transaminase